MAIIIENVIRTTPSSLGIHQSDSSVVSSCRWDVFAHPMIPEGKIKPQRPTAESEIQGNNHEKRSGGSRNPTAVTTTRIRMEMSIARKDVPLPYARLGIMFAHKSAFFGINITRSH
jgi:hypothetical protein